MSTTFFKILLILKASTCDASHCRNFGYRHDSHEGRTKILNSEYHLILCDSLVSPRSTLYTAYPCSHILNLEITLFTTSQGYYKWLLNTDSILNFNYISWNPYLSNWNSDLNPRYRCCITNAGLCIERYNVELSGRRFCESCVAIRKEESDTSICRMTTLADWRLLWAGSETHVLPCKAKFKPFALYIRFPGLPSISQLFYFWSSEPITSPGHD